MDRWTRPVTDRLQVFDVMNLQWHRLFESEKLGDFRDTWANTPVAQSRYEYSQHSQQVSLRQRNLFDSQEQSPPHCHVHMASLRLEICPIIGGRIKIKMPL